MRKYLVLLFILAVLVACSLARGEEQPSVQELIDTWKFNQKLYDGVNLDWTETYSGPWGSEEKIWNLKRLLGKFKVRWYEMKRNYNDPEINNRRHNVAEEILADHRGFFSLTQANVVVKDQSTPPNTPKPRAFHDKEMFNKDDTQRATIMHIHALLGVEWMDGGWKTFFEYLDKANKKVEKGLIGQWRLVGETDLSKLFVEFDEKKNVVSIEFKANDPKPGDIAWFDYKLTGYVPTRGQAASGGESYTKIEKVPSEFVGKRSIIRTITEKKFGTPRNGVTEFPEQGDTLDLSPNPLKLEEAEKKVMRAPGEVKTEEWVSTVIAKITRYDMEKQDDENFKRNLAIGTYIALYNNMPIEVNNDPKRYVIKDGHMVEWTEKSEAEWAEAQKKGQQTTLSKKNEVKRRPCEPDKGAIGLVVLITALFTSVCWWVFTRKNL